MKHGGLRSIDTYTRKIKSNTHGLGVDERIVPKNVCHGHQHNMMRL